MICADCAAEADFRKAHPGGHVTKGSGHDVCKKRPGSDCDCGHRVPAPVTGTEIQPYVAPSEVTTTEDLTKLLRDRLARLDGPDAGSRQ